MSGWTPSELAVERPGVRAVARALRRYRGQFAGALAAGVLQQALRTAALVVAALAVGRAVAGETAGLGWYVAGAVALVVARALADWFEAWLSHDVAYRLLADIRVTVFSTFARLAPSGLVWRRSGDLVTRAMSDAEELEHLYAHVALYVGVAVILTPVGLLGLVVFDPLVALAVVPFLAATAVVPFRIRARNSRLAAELRRRQAELASAVVTNVQGMRDVLAYGQQEVVLRQLLAAGDEVGRVERRLLLGTALEQTAGTALASAAGLGALVAAALLAADGRMDATQIPAAAILGGLAAAPILALLGSTRHVATSVASGARIAELTTTEGPVADTGTRRPAPGAPAVALRDVTFTYPAGSRPALQKVTLTVEPATTVALVGPSGAGKSTLVQLVLRFADPDAGAVELGGTDLRELALPALRDHVAYVPQDVMLFARSVRENLLLGCGARDDDALRDALARAHALDEILALPSGLDTVLGPEGPRLSGGQRQRLAIARALLRDAPVLVLDEPSSMLDPHGEERLRQALDALRHDRTILVVAHRVRLMQWADRVAVLDDGRLVADGTHDALLAESGVYQRIVEPQLRRLADTNSGSER